MEQHLRILLVEDDRSLLNSLSYILQAEGYEVFGATSGEEGLVLAARHLPNLVLLDIDLPEMDGFEVAERLAAQRASRGMLVVMLTGSDLESHIVRALATCADDYIVKPVRPRVLLVRLGALLRRRTSSTVSLSHLRIGEITVDIAACEARRGTENLGLTPTEFKILALLAQSPNRAISRLELIRCIHGDGIAITERSIDFQIHWLRRKLGKEGEKIETVRGIGFLLRHNRESN